MTIDTILNPNPRVDMSRHIAAVAAIAETIRVKGEVPSGHLYALLLGRMDLEMYQAIIAILKRCGAVEESGDVLRWVGPEVET